MKQLAALLLAAPLLAASACSKDEPKPAPVPPATGSYTLDGRKVVATEVSGGLTPGSAGIDDLLTIRLVSAGSPTQTLDVVYAKRVGTPASAYRPSTLRYTAGTGPTYTYSQDLRMTLTNNGSAFSGTFSGTFPGQGRSQIVEGVFANVR